MRTLDNAVSTVRRTYDLLSLAQKDTELKRQGRYHIGPCPFCKTGTDRFAIKETNAGYLWICRKCGSGKYEDSISYIMRRENISFMQAMSYMQKEGGVQLSESERIVIENKEKERQALIDHKLLEFTTGEIWEALHRRMVAEEIHKSWWRCSGVPDEWQVYLRLGYTPDKPYKVGDNICHSPAYTIPYFHYNATSPKDRLFQTLQYRLTDPQCKNDKYRFEYGLSSTYYMVTPTLPIGSKVIVCEGAKKAIVTHLFTGDENITVLGIPSKSDFCDLDKVLAHCERVWVVLDPDACDRAVMLAETMGDQARVIELPVKIDDAFMSGALRKADWRVYLDTQAVKV